MKKKFRKKGFTLSEVIITLVVIGIVAVIITNGVNYRMQMCGKHHRQVRVYGIQVVY